MSSVPNTLLLTPAKKRGRPKGTPNSTRIKSKATVNTDTDGPTTPKPKLEPESEDDGPRKTPKRQRRASLTPSPSPGEWTPAKRAEFIDTIIANGYKATNLDELSGKLGLKKRQLINQLAPGRKGSFREKAVGGVSEVKEKGGKIKEESTPQVKKEM